MKKTLSILIAATLLLTACGQRHELKERLNQARHASTDAKSIVQALCDLANDTYTALEVDHALAVVMHDSVQQPRVEAEREEDMAAFTMRLEDGTLSFSRPQAGTCRGITIYLPTSAALRRVELDGASTFRGTLQATDGLHFEADGASRLEATLANEATHVSVESDGASKVIVRGKAQRVTVEADGAAHANVSDLAVRTAEVDLDGAGCTKVNASERISGSVEGASHLMYLGNPALSVKQDDASRVNQIAEGDKYKQF